MKANHSHPNRRKQNQAKAPQKGKDEKKKDDLVREIPQVSSSLFFQYNTALTPPYSILVDTNFLSHTVQHKLEVIPTMMDCLYAKCIPIVTDCVLAELEKLGPKYRIALRIAKDPRFERLKCDHKGTYADDCLVDRVIKHRVYIVATNDRDLKRRIRKIPGVPIMSVARAKYVIERLPDAPEK
ncbi:U3 small nucleolar RNA-associated protein 24 [[Emmonsia] crescens]|uniref:U3 small nucleolar RNA-associated protein 24 n=1 Tax=[Emmonsia] crescens TaxID=73230 RepID=A0A2B7Z9B5_9EURO|nr:U3 small nucleolar RNA-associated protein 24 [Emmonsia crescens]